jgi:hypothetical protein
MRPGRWSALLKRPVLAVAVAETADLSGRKRPALLFPALQPINRTACAERKGRLKFELKKP